MPNSTNLYTLVSIVCVLLFVIGLLFFLLSCIAKHLDGSTDKWSLRVTGITIILMTFALYFFSWSLSTYDHHVRMLIQIEGEIEVLKSFLVRDRMGPILTQHIYNEVVRINREMEISQEFLTRDWVIFIPHKRHDALLRLQQILVTPR